MNMTTLKQNIELSRKQKTLEIGRSESPRCSDGLNRLLCAAVVNENFCRMLLASPVAAMREGYQGYQFDLDEREVNALAAIRSVSLDDFARQLISACAQTQSVSENHESATLEFTHITR